jgi:kynurenine 3-monooxygenase
LPKHVLIIGAGLVGSLAAVYFARRGWRVSVYERRPDPRAKGYIGGRSINLALSVRGLWGLAGVDLDRTVLERDAIPMPGRMIHPAPSANAAAAQSGTIFQPYSKNPADAINSVSRGGLNLTLLHAAAAAPGVELVFDRRCLDVDLDRCRASFVDDTRPTDPPTIIEADLIFAGDGAFSAVRTAMQKTDRFEYSQSYLEHGYKELHIPSASELGIAGVGIGRWAGGDAAAGSRSKAANASFALDPNALHIWPRGGSMMIALPNRDGSFTCTLFWPFAGDHSFAQLEGDLIARKLIDPHGAPTAEERAGVAAHFQRHYPDAVPLMPTLVHDFFANPTSSLVTVRCAPWFRMARDGKRATVLAGDAAHAIVPFYGQGMNAGFEDVRILAECLDRAPGTGGAGDLAAALAEYHALRKPNADAIADMAIENFTEMRDKVGSPAFRYRKRVEQTIHDAFPDRVAPQYNLVSFSTVPYAEARRRGRDLDAVLDRVIERLGPDSPARLGEDAWKREVAAAAGDLLG